MQVSLHGFDGIISTLEVWAPKEAKAVIRQATHAAAVEVRNALKDSAYVGEDRELHTSDGRTILIKGGTIKKSFRARRRRGMPGEVRSSVTILKRAFYWRFIEFGTAHHPAFPFLRPAWDRMKKKILIGLRKHLFGQLAKRLRKK